MLSPDAAAILSSLIGRTFSLDELIAALETTHELVGREGSPVRATIAARIDDMVRTDLIDRLP